MRAIITVLVVLALLQGAYAACDCPEPSDWGKCSGGEQERFIYNCNDTTGGNCFGEKETRLCAAEIPIAMWVMFITLIVALFAVVFLLFKHNKKL